MNTQNVMTKKTTMDISVRYRTFEVKYIGPSNVRGSRYQIKDLRHGTKRTLPYDYEFRDCQDSALNYLESIGITVDAMALTDNTAFLLSKDFETKLI